MQKYPADLVRKNEMFQRIFGIVTLCSIMVVIIFATISFYLVNKMVKDQNIAYAEDIFEETCSTIGEIENRANALATQILLDNACYRWLVLVDSDELDYEKNKFFCKKIVIFMTFLF